VSGFHRVCALAEIPEGGVLAAEVDGEPVAVVRADGQVFAIHDVCSHAEVPLSEGDVVDGEIECWLHGSRFDLRTGKPTGPPASAPVPVYPVRVDEAGDVLVDVDAPVRPH
jgi:3-phenylpropionate/trans-cinnamate dioxygenase ferredoxin subunit